MNLLPIIWFAGGMSFALWLVWRAELRALRRERAMNDELEKRWPKE